MKAAGVLGLLLMPVAAIAHPGGGLVALDEDTVIFGDSMYNTLWRLAKGGKPQPVIRNIHAHWVTRGLDGQIYSESFQEMGGPAYRVDLDGGRQVRVADAAQVPALVFAVNSRGEFVFQQGPRLVVRTRGGLRVPFRGSGAVAKGEPPLGPILAYCWVADSTLFLSDGGHLRRVGSDGIVRLVARVDGDLVAPAIWNATGAPRIWSIAIDGRRRIYAALPDLGQVVRIDPDGTQHIVERGADDWRVTAVATFGESVFLLESSVSTNAGQRVRVMRGAGTPELLGQVEP